MNNKLEIIKNIFSYSASGLTAQAVGLVAGFWVARILGPADFGIWNAVSLVLSYGAYLELGALSAMGRELPYYQGQGSIEKATAVEGAARRITIIGALFAALLVLIFSFFPFHSSKMALGLQVMAVALILQQVYTYHRVVLRSFNEFSELSRQQLLFAVLNSVMAVGLVIYAGLTGRLMAAVIALAMIVLYALRKNPWKPVPIFKLREAMSLIRIGIPIVASGFILSLLVTVDRLMVITFLDEKQLGCIGIALMITGAVSLIPSLATQVMVPRINHVFGESGNKIEALRPFVMVPPRILSAVLPVLIGLVYIALPLIIHLFLPAYAEGITAARIVVVGTFFLSIIGLTDYFLITTGKLRQYTLFGCMALLINVALDYLFIRMGYGIEGVALGGTLITYFVYSCIVIGYALSHFTQKRGEFLRFFSRLWLPFIYMVAILWLIEAGVNFVTSFLGWSSLPVETFIQGFLYLAGCLPLCYLALRELKVDMSMGGLRHLW